MNILPNQQTAIDDQTLREITLDSFRGLGYRADLFDLQTFPASSCPWHWHNAFEINRRAIDLFAEALRPTPN